jgi:predicted dehydrogenase
LYYADFGKDYAPLEPIKATEVGIDWAVGLQDFTDSIKAQKPSRVTGTQAAHVVEILEATHTAIKIGQTIELQSSFVKPAPIEWVV